MKEKQKAPGWVPMVQVIRDREFTIAFGEFYDERFGVVPFAGATKKNPADNENVDRGGRLAIGNAFRHLGRDILKKEYAAIHKQFNTSTKKPKKVKVFDQTDVVEEFERDWDNEELERAYEAGYHQAKIDLGEE